MWPETKTGSVLEETKTGSVLEARADLLGHSESQGDGVMSFLF